MQDDEQQGSLHFTLRITPQDKSVLEQTVRLRIDTPIEVDTFRHGGILPFVLRQLLS